ncbi:hypothetical protein QJS10_CPB15g00822 [Acorus calamus]|uniref:RNase H type-1 domain-containing protein n=1 Tax=Acorus calamus TaxID=4465 RepID=A0AAV9D926_ACOCL|nr:hypothetical protein QJS10_CPB15g00822 [Acorus calamus]
MRKRYLRKDNMWRVLAPLGCSSTWSSILQARDWIQPKVQYLIFEEKSVNLWFDPWIKGKGLAQVFGRVSYDWGPPNEATVAVFISNGQWEMPHRSSEDLDLIWPKIQQLDVRGTGKDLLIWPASKTGILNLSEAWKAGKRMPIIYFWAVHFLDSFGSNSSRSLGMFYAPSKESIKLKTIHRFFRIIQTPDMVMVLNAFGVQIEEKENSSTIVKWMSPEDGWLKLNTDGSLANDRGGYEALIRNSNSEFQLGLAGRLDLPTINLLELKAIEQGVKLSSTMQACKLWIEIDSTTALAWLEGRGNIPWTAIRSLCNTHHYLQHLVDWKIVPHIRDLRSDKNWPVTGFFEVRPPGKTIGSIKRVVKLGERRNNPTQTKRVKTPKWAEATKAPKRTAMTKTPESKSCDCIDMMNQQFLMYDSIRKKEHNAWVERTIKLLQKIVLKLLSAAVRSIRM